MIIIPLTTKAIAPLGYLFSGIQKIVSEVLTYFAVSQYYYRLIGFLSSWISTLGASSVLVFSLVMSMALPSAACSTVRLPNRVFNGISVQITIRCSLSPVASQSAHSWDRRNQEQTLLTNQSSFVWKINRNDSKRIPRSSVFLERSRPGANAGSFRTLLQPTSSSSNIERQYSPSSYR